MQTSDLENLVFAFLDDQTIVVHKDSSEAISAYEGIDIENGDVLFYSGKGHFLHPVFDVPNKRTKFLWIFETIVNGTYHLEPNSGGGAVPISLKLKEVVNVLPNRWMIDLSTLKSLFPSER